MKVLFLYPNTSGSGEIPISISYLQSILKREGHEIEIFDTSDYKSCSSRPDEYQIHVGQFKTVEKRSDMPQLSLKDLDPKEDIIRVIKSFNPGLIAVTSFTTNYKFGVSLLREIKTHYKDIYTIFGGIHATLMPEEVISEPAVDMICVGEGEEPLVELCNKLSSGTDITSIRNLWFKTNGKIIRNEMRPLINLDDLPYQDFDGFNEYNFFRPLAGKIYKMANVDISRGCIFKCSYCINHTFQKKFKGLGSYHREKSVRKAIDNLVHIKNKYGVEIVRFWDEDFTVSSFKYLEEFCEEYRDKVKLPFLIYASASTMTEDKIRILKKAGCVTVAMGIESGNEIIRRNVLNRRITNENITKVFHLIKSYGVRISAYNMIGLPHETRKHIFDTIELNRVCRPDTSSVAFMEPYPNTEIYEDCVKNGYIEPGYTPTYDFFTPHIKELLISHKELRGLIKTFTLYTKVPWLFYPLVKICEMDNLISNIIFKYLVKLYGGQ